MQASSRPYALTDLNGKKVSVANTSLTLSGGKPFCLVGGYYDDARSYSDMIKAKGYKSHPEDLLFIHHAAGHRAPQWALEAGYAFLDRQLGVVPEVRLCS